MIENERTWLIAWATLQGFCLLMLHNLLDAMAKPGEWFVITWPLYVVVLAFPLTMQMLSAYRQRASLWWLNIAYVSVLAMCAAYAGKMSWVDGLSFSYASGAIFQMAGVVLVSWFVLIPFAEHRLKLPGWSSDYGLLGTAAWRNVVKLGSAGLFVVIFWMLLALWAGLFKVLGVGFFVELFTSRVFVYPVTAIAFGMGLSLYSAKEEALLGLYRATLNLLGWLLPLVSGIILLFLLMLPIQGIGLLWQTGYATGLVLSLLGLMIFLFNAAWQDGVHGVRFPRWVRYMVTLALCVLPALSAICAYALWLRVAQYGWTDERVWAAILIGLFALYALGYALSALQYKNAWMQCVSKVNTYAAWVVALVLILTSTPLLDPGGISVRSQVNRLLAEKVTAQSFDFQYLRFNGGWHGQRALERLSVLEQHPEAAAIRLKAQESLKAEHRIYGRPAAHNRTEWLKHLQVLPRGEVLPADFLEYLWQESENNKLRVNCLQDGASCSALQVDLNRDGVNEILLIGTYNTRVFTLREGQWSAIGDLRAEGSLKLSNPELQKLIGLGQFSVVESAWQDLQVGNRHFVLQPD